MTSTTDSIEKRNDLGAEPVRAQTSQMKSSQGENKSIAETKPVKQASISKPVKPTEPVNDNILLYGVAAIAIMGAVSVVYSNKRTKPQEPSQSLELDSGNRENRSPSQSSRSLGQQPSQSISSQPIINTQASFSFNATAMKINPFGPD